MNAESFQAVEADGLGASGAEAAKNLAARADAGALELVDVLHVHEIVFDAHHLADGGDAAAPIVEAGTVHHDIDGAGQLLADDLIGYVLRGHHDHGFEARESVARGIGVNRGHGAIVAGVHGLKHVERFGAARLAHDDAVGAHAEGVDHQVALRDGAGALDIGGAGFQADHVVLLQLQLGGVLDGDDALLFGDEPREGVEHGGLAGAGPARDHDIEARLHAAAHEIEHAGGQSFVAQKFFGGEDFLSVAADGEDGADQRERRDDGADARAVEEAGIDDGRRVVDAAAHGGHDALDDHAHMGLVLEADIGFDDAAGALDVDVVEAVDHDVADGGVFEERLQGAEAENFVEDFLDEPLALDEGHGKRLFDDQLFDYGADLAADAVFVEVLELIGRERIEKFLVNVTLQFKPAIRARTGPDQGTATQGILQTVYELLWGKPLPYGRGSEPSRERQRAVSAPSCGLPRGGFFGAGGFVHEGAEGFVEVAGLLAIGYERARFVDGGDHGGGLRNAEEYRLVQGLANLFEGGDIGAGLLGIAVHDDADLVLAEPHAHQERDVALGVSDGGKLLIDHQEDGGGDLRRGHHHFVGDGAAGIDYDGIVLLHQEGGELAELVFAELRAALQGVGRTDHEEAQGIAGDESFEQGLVHALQVFGDLGEGVLRGCAHLHCHVVADPIQIEDHAGELALRQHGHEIHGQGGGADAAAGSKKSVDLAEFAGAGGGLARSTVQSAHGVAELGALKGLDQKLVGSGAHAGDGEVMYTTFSSDIT